MVALLGGHCLRIFKFLINLVVEELPPSGLGAWNFLYHAMWTLVAWNHRHFSVDQHTSMSKSVKSLCTHTRVNGGGGRGERELWAKKQNYRVNSVGTCHRTKSGH